MITKKIIFRGFTKSRFYLGSEPISRGTKFPKQYPVVSEKETFRPWESPPKKIPKHKSSISTSDKAVQCESLTHHCLTRHQPVELNKLNARSEGLIHKNGYYPRKPPEKPDFYIDENYGIESRRLDDPMPRRQSSRNRRPPKRFRSPPPTPKPTTKPKKSENSKAESESKKNLIPDDILITQSIKEIRAILSNDSKFSDPNAHRKRVTSKVDFSI